MFFRKTLKYHCVDYFMTSQVFFQIKELLDNNSVEYQHIVHEPVKTSKEAADTRGFSLDDGAKALILKVQNKEGSNNENLNRTSSYSFIQCVISASQRIDLKKVKLLTVSKNVALASPEEVLEKTGCTIGSVPPFGILFGIKMYIDKSVLTREMIVFSAGTHTDSIRMKPQDYIEIVGAEVVDIRKE